MHPTVTILVLSGNNTETLLHWHETRLELNHPWVLCKRQFNILVQDSVRLWRDLAILKMCHLPFGSYPKSYISDSANAVRNINHVILFDDKVIILYNTNDREIKQLDKRQLKEAESAENLEEITENNSLGREFKRVALGGTSASEFELSVHTNKVVLCCYLVVKP